MTVNHADLEHMRILHCAECGTIDELPDHEGGPESDGTLDYLTRSHPGHTGKLFRFPVAYWLMEEVRRSIIEQVKGGSTGLAAFDSSFYETRSTFQEDAGTCYKAHNSPKGQCSDWYSDKKRLLPDTKEERKQAGLPILRLDSAGPKRYLCDFCPVRMYNEHRESTS